MTTFSVPGKTFLLGEYVALDGGPSLLVSTEPRFELEVGGKSESEFHPQSPAGLFAAKNAREFSKLSFRFHDPYKGMGGLGASSAQFALLWAVRAEKRGFDLSKGANEIDWRNLLRDYRECAWSGEGVPPSGADVVSQITGGLTWFDGRSESVEKLGWGFETLAFSLIRTGHKLATHEHLKASSQAPHQSLRSVVLEGRKAIDTRDEMRMIEAVQGCAHILRESGLTAEFTLGLLDKMRMKPELFYAAKGCGAMGADIVLVLHESAKAPDVRSWANALGLTVIATEKDLTTGLEIRRESP